MRKRVLDGAICLFAALALATLVLLIVYAGRYVRARREVTVPTVPPAVLAADQPSESAMYTLVEGTVTRQNGERISLEELRGRPVLLLFWSSWCPDCKGYMQQGMAEAFKAARDAGASCFLVCREGRRGESWETALQGLADMSVMEETVMDEGSRLYESLGLRSVPSVALLNREGRLVAATTKMPDEEAVLAMLDLAETGHQAQTENFLREKLLDGSGAIPSSYRVQGQMVVPDGDVLSETMGLMMEYAVAAKDQALFDRLLTYVRNEMTVGGLSPWRVSQGEKANVNASLDDLRILDALLLAEKAWGGYQHELSFRESALYRLAVKDGHLRDYVTLDTGAACDAVTLCYLDVAAMEQLAEYAGKWGTVADNARSVLKGGVISEKFPLFYPRYDPKTRTYSGEQMQMNEALVTVYHAAKAGIDVTAALDWLERQMQEGAIFAYYTMEGAPKAGYLYESTATYALLAQAAMLSGREELARTALARLERKRCFTEPLVGDLGSVADERHYAFDVVQTLLAWQKWALPGKETEQ